VTAPGRTTMSALQWQLANDAARHYEEVLVPAYLGPAARVVVARAGLAVRQSVLDVGCGTGAAAREAHRLVGPEGRVLGVDVNRYMLQVARDASPGVEFREGDARQLPLRDASFDVAVCANTLQFVPERSRAAQQMARVLHPGGRVGVGTWETIDRNPYFEALAGAISATMGAQVATALTSACTLGTPEELWGVLVAGGFTEVRVDKVTLDVILPDLDRFVPRHLASTPMAAAFRGAGDEAVAAVVRDVEASLGAGERDGRHVPFRLLVATAHVPV
jgi:SAM-dependent methyltransferase